MQKLRKAYPQIQADAKNNFDKVTLQRAKMLFAYSNKEYESQVAQDNYNNLDQISFYQDKFKILIDLFNNAIANKTKKSKLQSEIVALLTDNYGQAVASTPQYVREDPKVNQKFEPEVLPDNGKQAQSAMPASGDPKDLLASFFDIKKNQIEKSKTGFKSVLQIMPKVINNHSMKSSHHPRRGEDNDSQITFLNSQIKALQRKLDEEKEATNFNQGIYQAQKQDYEYKIKELVQQVQKIKSSRGSPLGHSHHAPPPVQTRIVYRDNGPIEDYSPHSNKYRQNNLNKLREKGPGGSQTDFRKSEEEPPVYQTSRVARFDPDIERKNSGQELIGVLHNDRNDLAPPTDYDFQASNLRFARSEAQNQGKNVMIRSKLAFFRNQLVIYRGQTFEVAIKSYDMHDLSTRKITIYVNNKDRFDRSAKITYTHDSTYYDLNVTRKITELSGCKQAKEELLVKLKQKTDFDSMIEAKLVVQNSSINPKQITFVLPTMFIEFTNRKPQYYGRENYEKSHVAPLYQFSSIYSAMDIIPFDKDYEDKIQVASIFARSKYHEGYLIIRWKIRGEIEIETIKPWKLLFSYLFSKQT